MSSQNIPTINLNYLDQLGIKRLIIPDGSYNIPQIQDYFEFIIKQHETIAD